MNNRMIRLPVVKHMTGFSRSTIYAMMQRGDFPKNITLGARAVGWIEADVQAWIDSRISAKKSA